MKYVKLRNMAALVLAVAYFAAALAQERRTATDKIPIEELVTTVST